MIGGADYGRAFEQAVISVDLGSAGAGVRIVFNPRAWLEVEGARVVDEPYPGYRGKWRVNVSWRLQLKKS